MSRTGVKPTESASTKLNPQRQRVKTLTCLIRQACYVSAGMLFGQQAFAGPEGGQIVGGDGSIAQSGSTTTVQQQSQNLAIEWQQFNVAAEETVRFVQPSSSSAVLNRILDQNPSEIYGSIEANGRVFLINPNGLIFGQTANINVGSLVASTLDISTADFMEGKYTFKAQEGGEGGMVINRGLMKAATGGSISLIGGSVSNEGLILADYGQVNLGAGRQVTLDFDGDGLIRFQVDEEVLTNAAGIDSAVSNSGQISADGGSVLLTAQAARDVFSNVVNNEGVIRAGRIENEGGVVRLVGTGGITANAGTIDASGQTETDTGGTVEVLGDKVALMAGSDIDASGPAGGGTVLVGGDYQGSGETPTASRTYVDAEATIRADATEAGDGGKVIVWADEATGYYGSISAKGGEQSGDGGFVEVSGKQTLQFDGMVDTSAVNGAYGQLLLDPNNILIVASGGSDLTSPINILYSDNPGTDSSINVASIEGATSDVTLQATNNIEFQTVVNMMNDGVGLTAQAGNDIILYNGIATNGRAVTLQANYDFTTGGVTYGTGQIILGAYIKTNGGNVLLQTGEGGVIRLDNDYENTISAGHGVVVFDGYVEGPRSNQWLNVEAGDVAFFGDVNVDHLSVYSGSSIAMLGSQNTISSVYMASGRYGGEILGDGPDDTFDFGSADFGSGQTTLWGNLNIEHMDTYYAPDLILAGDSSITFMQYGKLGSVQGFHGLNLQGGQVNILGDVDVAYLNSSVDYLRIGGDVSALGDLDLGQYGTVEFDGAYGTLINAENVYLDGVQTLARSDLFINAPGTVALGPTEVMYGDMTIFASEIDFRGGQGSVRGFGYLYLESSAPVILGGTEGTAALDLSGYDLDALDYGFAGVNIGSGGVISTAGQLSFTGDLTLQSVAGVNLGHDVRSDGSLTFSGPVLVTNSLTISGGPLSFQNATVDGAGMTLSLDANGSDIILGNVGTSGAMGVSLSNVNSVRLAGTLNLSGGADFTAANQVVVVANSAINTTADNGNVSLAGTPLNGPGGLTISSGTGTVTLADVGQTTRLAYLTINSASTILGGNVFTSGQVNLSGTSVEAGSVGQDLHIVAVGATILGSMGQTKAFGNVNIIAGTINQQGSLKSTGDVTFVGANGITMAPMAETVADGTITYTSDGDITLARLETDGDVIVDAYGGGSIYNGLYPSSEANISAANATLKSWDTLGTRTAPLNVDVPDAGTISLVYRIGIVGAVNVNSPASSDFLDLAAAGAGAFNKGQSANKGETGYVDWSVFSPDLSIFGVMEPGIRLPDDQLEVLSESSDDAKPLLAFTNDGWQLLWDFDRSPSAESDLWRGTSAF